MSPFESEFAMRIPVALALALLLAAPAMAADTPPAATDPNLNLTYTLYAGGLKVVNVGVVYHIGHSAYSVHANARTTGMWSSLVPWRNMIAALGTVDDKGVHPTMARYDDAWREKLRSTEFNFGNGVVSAVATPPHRADGRTEATEAQRTGAMDPLSAVINVLAQGGERGCQGKMAAYDGRRVYNLVFSNKGTETLARNRYSIFSGPAVRCEVLFEPVAGFPKREERAGFWSARDNAEAKNPLIIWIAKPAADLPELPVRVQSTVELGTLVAHIRAINPVVQSAALP